MWQIWIDLKDTCNLLREVTENSEKIYRSANENTWTFFDKKIHVDHATRTKSCPSLGHRSIVQGCAGRPMSPGPERRQGRLYSRRIVWTRTAHHHVVDGPWGTCMFFSLFSVIFSHCVILNLLLVFLGFIIIFLKNKLCKFGCEHVQIYAYLVPRRSIHTIFFYKIIINSTPHKTEFNHWDSHAFLRIVNE